MISNSGISSNIFFTPQKMDSLWVYENKLLCNERKDLPIVNGQKFT